MATTTNPPKRMRNHVLQVSDFNKPVNDYDTITVFSITPERSQKPLNPKQQARNPKP